MSLFLLSKNTLGGIEMIIVLKSGTSQNQLDEFKYSLEQYGVAVNVWVGTQSTVLGLIGDTTVIDIDNIAAQGIVESVKRVQEPYKKANRKFHFEDTVINVRGKRCWISAWRSI
jgi:3-deoxy-7-phosphoheptulonate synthase